MGDVAVVKPNELQEQEWINELKAKVELKKEAEIKHENP